MWSRILSVAFYCAVSPASLIAAEAGSNPGNNSAALLPREFSSNYLVAANTVSPNKKFALIYPKFDLCVGQADEALKNHCKDYLVALQPFRILCALATRWPHFEHKNHGGMTAMWSKDSSVVLVTLESKWGPGDVFLYELRDGGLGRSTDLLGQIHQLLQPEFRKSRAARYNDFQDFVFEQATQRDGTEMPPCQLEGSSRVRVYLTATTDPKHTSFERAWEGRFEGVWDIPQGKFTSQKIGKLFAGERR
jgi:hypothetical protein